MKWSPVYEHANYWWVPTSVYLWNSKLGSVMHEWLFTKETSVIKASCVRPPEAFAISQEQDVFELDGRRFVRYPKRFRGSDVHLCSVQPVELSPRGSIAAWSLGTNVVVLPAIKICIGRNQTESSKMILTMTAVIMVVALIMRLKCIWVLWSLAIFIIIRSSSLAVTAAAAMLIAVSLLIKGTC